MPANPTATLTMLTRMGFAARGLLYLVIASLVIQGGRTEDPTGALSVVASGGGRVLLYVIVAGFVAYGLWRLSDAAFNIERHEPGAKGVGERIGAAASGLVHLFLAWQAIKLLEGAARSGGSGAEQGAATALHLPGGQLLLIVGGLVLLGVGVAQMVQTYTLKFCESLEPSVAREAWVKWTGRGGYAARGLVFLITGYFLLRAGFAEQASRAGGMREALNWLTSPWDTIVAVGLALFGFFSLIEARYRVIHDVPVEGMARRAREKLPV
jgi:hypothetical protein